MSRKIEDLIGKKFNRWTIIGKSNKKYHYMCKCECGKIKSVSTDSLKRNISKSCGCLQINTVTKHGLYKSKLYKARQQMMQRCYNKNHEHYENWGGRGIIVCEEWLDKENGFNNFKEWSLNNGYQDNLTIDREDNNGDYSPQNCKWSTMKEQENNKRNNYNITFNGKTQTLTKWAEELNIKREIFYDRIRLGWSIEDTLITPVRKRDNNGQYK